MSSKFTFNLSASFQKFISMYFFTPDNVHLRNKFQMNYDNLSQTSFMGEITYQDSRKVENLWQKENTLFMIHLLSYMPGKN